MPKLDFGIMKKIRDKVVDVCLEDQEFWDSMKQGAKRFFLNLAEALVDAIFDTISHTLSGEDDE